MGLKALACASTGIAAELLIDGATAHRRFGIPNTVKTGDIPKIDRHSSFASVLDAAQLLIIDEVSMQDRAVIEYIDRVLRIISTDHEDLPFGGKVVVLGGDWKQLMPVIPGKGSDVQYAFSVKNSLLFRYFFI